MLKYKLKTTIGAILTLVVFIILIRYFLYLINSFPFDDEAETIVTSRMIANGCSLYSEIFNHHGPLVFFPALLLELISPVSIPIHRVWILFGQFLLCLSVVKSPLLSSNVSKSAFVALICCCLLIWFPQIYGHAYMYQSIAGILIGIGLLNFVLPSLYGIKVSQVANISGIVSLASLPFLAFLYIPIVLACFIVCYNKSVKNLLLGTIFLTLIFNIGLLCIFGSLKGYFAYHFYVNIAILPKYNGAGSVSALILYFYNQLSLNPTLLLCCFTLVLSLLILYPRLSFFKLIILIIGFGTLLIRPQAFHLLPFYYSTLFLSIIFFKRNDSDNIFCVSTLALLSLYLIIKCSLLFPIDQKIQRNHIPNQSEFANLAKILTNKDDRILVYSFRNREYIISERLPASGHFFYLPWQYEYNLKPILGIYTNPVQDILLNKPKIIYADKWKVWKKYDWISYAKEINGILNKEYVQYGTKPYYIRKDLVKESSLITNDFKSALSNKINNNSPIQLISDLPQSENISSIYILFATYKFSELKGDLNLSLNDINGKHLSIPIPLNKIKDNQYLKIDVPNQKYKKIELDTSSIKTLPLSVWQTLSPTGTKSCLIYKYTDGSFSFTSGCPIAPVANQ